MILQAKNITKTFYYPNVLKLLQGIELEVFLGQSVAIMGRSGEGKSSLLQILGTLDSATSGKLIINGKLVTSQNTGQIRSQEIGFIFQAFHLLEDYSVIQNVLMPARIARKNVTKNSLAYKRAEDLLLEVGLKARLHHFGRQLSGGEKQRVAIARALCNNPSLLLADEPTGNLDHKTAESIQEILLNYTKKKQKSLILVTHDPKLAALCDKTYQLEQGKLYPSAP